MNIIVLKQATVADIDELQTISVQTFYDAFADRNTEEDMKQYLDKSFNKNVLKTELENPDSQFYFALLDDAITGYLKLNTGKAQTERKEDAALEIERVYVLQKYQGNKVGQALVDKAFQLAKKKNAPYVWLGVWEENMNAIRFYKRNGFVEFSKHRFLLGNDEQTDILMRLDLV